MTKIAYLTIDDAPSATFLDKFAFIQERNIPAVWFAQGNYTEQRPHMMLEAIRQGAIIGNHSYSHPHFSELSVDQCFAEIRSTDAILDELHAQANIPRRYRYFRFPYGDKGDLRHGENESPHAPDGAKRHAEIQAYLRRLGYTSPPMQTINYEWFQSYLADVDWYWTYDSHDWSPFTGNPMHGITTSEHVLARLDDNVPDGWRGLNDDHSGDIILVHDFAGEAHNLFKRIITRIEEKGIQLQSVV